MASRAAGLQRGTARGSGANAARRKGGRVRVGPRAAAGEPGPNELWMPDGNPIPRASSMPEAATAPSESTPRTPPPDLPSLLLDSRIVYLGMPLVGNVTELIVAEILYLQYVDRVKPIYLYINSAGTANPSGEQIGHETEGTAVYDTMKYVGNDIYTVGTGQAIGTACVLLSAGTPGKRFMMPHATAMLQQPRSPPTGTRQAVEVAIRAREVKAQKDQTVDILAHTTGQPREKIDRDIQRPLYMQPKDAQRYGIIDHVLTKGQERAIDSVKSPEERDREAGLR